MWQKKAAALYHNLFNLKFAIISAICNGAIAVVINWPYGPGECVAAGLTQAVSSFLSTGVTARVVQHFSPLRSALASYFWGSLIPALLTFSMSFAAHWWNNTPEIVVSCMAPTAISYTTSYVTNFITRRGHMRPGNYKEVDP